MLRSSLPKAFLAAAALAALAGCGAAMKPTSLKVSGNVPDAAVTIDDQYIGSLKFVSGKGVALPPGKHRITVERTGYFPWDRLVEATSDQPITLDVQMVPIPD